MQDPSFDLLQSLDDREWARALSFCDGAGLTLVLGAAARDSLPGWVRDRIERDLANNTQRHERAKAALFEIQDWLATEGIAPLVLKGFTQAPAFIPDPALRPQYDIDLYCPQADVLRARDLLLEHGYEPLLEFEDFPTDHLPVMVRKTGWQWRGDFFDPDIPFSVELHFRFWDEHTEHLPVPGIDDLWRRRVERVICGRPVSVLRPVDALGYTALHLVRHLLRGSLRAYHVYELARFLDAHNQNDGFWADWQALHGPELRRLEAVAFGLAAAWFGCRLRDQAVLLPDGADAWLERYAFAPLEGLFLPNKDELWLHLSLLESAASRRSVLRRRLLPLRMPGPVDAIHIPRSRMTWRRRMESRLKYSAYLGGRVWFHVRVLPRFALHGMTWSLGSGYWLFLAAASLFNLGMFVFVLLYNLLLLDRGFGERTIGLVSGMATAGSLAGTLPAAALARRFGLRALLLACFASVAIFTALRICPVGQTALALLGFAAGTGLAMWAVSIAPVISQLTRETRRPLGFSVFFASSIALGAAGGWLAGRLPGWLGGKPQAILAGCVLMLVALWPAARLPLGVAPAAPRLVPRSRFVLRFLIALAVWNLATGAFNPFFNAYFARRYHMPVERIGLLYSGAQLAQVGAILLAPLMLRKLGMTSGIAITMAATAAALAGLAAGGSATTAVAAYSAYMTCQFMTEPGLYTLLMGGVAPAERGGAAAVNFLVAFGAQALAAFVAGAAFGRFGYGPVLAAAAVAAGLAALLFRALVPSPGEAAKNE